MTDTLTLTPERRAFLRSATPYDVWNSDEFREHVGGAERVRLGHYAPHGDNELMRAVEAFKATLTEPAPTPDVDWAPAEEGEPHRAAQANALATMRQREFEANLRTEQATRERDALQRELDTFRDRVSELNAALNEQAEEREWCDEFEEFVSNFPDLLSVEQQEVTVTLQLTLNRNAGTDEYDIARYLYDLSSAEDIRNTIQSID